MPQLWNETIVEHRQAVTEAVLDAVASLAGAEGLTAVTMARVAEEAGIGRATLYRYFPHLTAVLAAWHARTVSRHLSELKEVCARAPNAFEALKSVMEAYALNIHQHGGETAVALHRLPHVTFAVGHFRSMIRDLIDQAAPDVRSDISSDELATYIVSALSAAETLPSKAAVRRLVAFLLAALRPDFPVQSGRAML